MNSTIWRGFSNPIKESELWDLHYSNKTTYLYEKFNRYYRKKLQKKVTRTEGSPKLNGKSEFDHTNGKDINGNHIFVNGSNKKDELIKSELNGRTATNGVGKLENGNGKDVHEILYKDLLNKPPNVNLVGPLLKTFWKEFIIVALFRLFALCIQFINPLILDYLLTYIKNDGSKWEGVVYGLGMSSVMLGFSLANNQYEWRINILGMKIRSVLTMAIYRKTMLLSSTGRHIYSTGEIVNLMGNDCERIFEVY